MAGARRTLDERSLAGPIRVHGPDLIGTAAPVANEENLSAVRGKRRLRVQRAPIRERMLMRAIGVHRPDPAAGGTTVATHVRDQAIAVARGRCAKARSRVRDTGGQQRNRCAQQRPPSQPRNAREDVTDSMSSDHGLAIRPLGCWARRRGARASRKWRSCSRTETDCGVLLVAHR